jgi:hypothetical protein
MHDLLCLEPYLWGSCPDYKEKKESDIPAPYRKKIPCKTDVLFPIEVVEEDPNRYKVHYIGYNSEYDEWKEKDTIVDIGDPDPGDHACCGQEHIELYFELATRIKTALNSSRKESPTVRINLPFDRIEFDGGLRLHGVKKRCVCGIQRYTITKFQILINFLEWIGIIEGINMNRLSPKVVHFLHHSSMSCTSCRQVHESAADNGKSYTMV